MTRAYDEIVDFIALEGESGIRFSRREICPNYPSDETAGRPNGQNELKRHHEGNELRDVRQAKTSYGANADSRNRWVCRRDYGLFRLLVRRSR